MSICAHPPSVYTWFQQLFRRYALLAGWSTTVSTQDSGNYDYVPLGQFIMGSEKGLLDEQPAHTVTLDAFWLDATEVTNDMYSSVSRPGDANSQDSYLLQQHTVFESSCCPCLMGECCGLLFLHDRRLPPKRNGKAPHGSADP